MKRLLALGSLFLAAGCVTTKMAHEIISPRYVGHPADNFFAKYGPPIQRYEMANGETIYTWRSGVDRVHLSGTSTYRGQVSNTGQISGTATHTPASAIPLFCELRFVVGPNSRIQRLDISRDTWGWWQPSRCAEIFDGE